MKHDIARWRADPVLAPNQLSVTRPLRPEDLDRYVSWHGIYPSQPAPTGVPWSEYIRSQRNGSRSVSSFTEALDSDQARYVTKNIFQHARSMATGSRSLPTNSPVHYFQPIDRGYMSESGLSDRYSLRAAIGKGICRSSSDGYATGLDDYDTMFEARHGREMIDIVPRVSAPMISTKVVPTTFGGIIPAPSSTGMIVNPRTEIISTSGSPFQKKCIPMGADRVLSPSSSHIIGEDATVFTDMADTMLKVLDWWMALTAQAREFENFLAENALATGQPRSQLTSYVKTHTLTCTYQWKETLE